MLKEVPQDLPSMNRAQRKAWDKLTKSAAFQKASPYRQAVELHRKGLGFMVPKDVYTDVSIPNLAPIALLNATRPSGKSHKSAAQAAEHPSAESPPMAKACPAGIDHGEHHHDQRLQDMPRIHWHPPARRGAAPDCRA